MSYMHSLVADHTPVAKCRRCKVVLEVYIIDYHYKNFCNDRKGSIEFGISFNNYRKVMVPLASSVVIREFF